MNIKRIIALSIIIILFAEAGIFFNSEIQANAKNTQDAQTATVKSVDSTIAAEGTIIAQDQATLHFQTGGKLVSVPFKEGDKISQGQTIAQLDTYNLQRQLTQSLNTYRSTRDQFDQAQQSQNNGIVQKTSAQTSSNGTQSFSTSPNSFGGDNGYTYLNDVAKRIVDENQANLDNSVMNVEIANYALQMATLTSPLTGIVTHEDVTITGQNVTPATSFVVSDPTTKVFRANIPAGDIDYVTEGMQASVILDGVQNKINGTIVKIYPSKTTLADGEEVYQVDIKSDDIENTGKLDQAGTAIIMTNAQNVMLVPAWTILSGKYVWVNNNGTMQLRTVNVGKKHGDQIEITGGLSKNDQVVTDPKSIPAKNYPIL